MQIPLSGYGGRSELRIINMQSTPQNEDLYCHTVHASSDQSAIVAAVVANRGNQVAFVNALAFGGICLVCFYQHCRLNSSIALSQLSC